jgi:hypothetical protein
VKWALRASLLIGMVSSGLLAQNETYKISGTVVDHATNRPLSKMLVQATPVRASQESDAGRFTRTDNDGHFAFANLPPGKYVLLAGRQPSSMQFFQGDEGFSTAIAVGPGLDSEHVVFPLAALGSISGTVLDEEGAGLKNAMVYLYWQHIVSGRPETASYGQQQTKTSGSFRFTNLQPGTYFLAVHAHPWYAGSETTNQEFDVAYPLTYYADATDVSSASPITVAEGAAANLQMVLRPMPAIHVRFSGLETGTGVNLQPIVSAIGPSGRRITLNANYTTVNNHPELGGIAPGRYELSINAFENGRGQTVGTKMVDLQNGADVDLSSMSHCSITGRIAFAGGVRAPNPLTLYFSQAAGSQHLPVTVAADGTFQVPALPPGRYQIGINGPDWFHFRSIDVKGGTFKDGLLDLPDGAKVQVSLTASTDKTALSGIALRDEKPVAGAMVLLFPEDPDRSDLIRRDQSDSDGTFTLPDVPPGRYRVLAIDNGHGLAYGNAAVIKPYLPSSQTITVDAGKQLPLKVNVQARLP